MNKNQSWSRARPAGESDEDSSDDDYFDMPSSRRNYNSADTSNCPSQSQPPLHGIWGEERDSDGKDSGIGADGLQLPEGARIACMKGDIETMKVFFESNSETYNVNCYFGQVDNKDCTPLITAAFYAHHKLLNFLLEHDADAKKEGFMAKITALMAAVGGVGNEEDVMQCVQILIEAGCPVNHVDRCGLTALLVAVRRQGERRKVVECLLNHKADPNLTDVADRSCLFHAAQLGDGKLCRLLLENGADVDMCDAAGWTAYDLAKEEHFDHLSQLLFKWKLEPNPTLLTKIEECTDSDRANMEHSQHTSRDDVETQMILRSISQATVQKYSSVFQTEGISYLQCLLLDNEHLKILGIEEMGTRKALLKQIRDIHTALWDDCALVRTTINKPVRVPEVVAMLKNMQMHIDHCRTSLHFIQKRLLNNQRRSIIQEKTINDTIVMLNRLAENNIKLEKAVLQLRTFLEAINDEPEFQVGDLIQSQASNVQGFYNQWKDGLPKNSRKLWAVGLGGIVGLLFGLVSVDRFRQIALGRLITR